MTIQRAVESVLQVHGCQSACAVADIMGILADTIRCAAEVHDELTAALAQAERAREASIVEVNRLADELSETLAEVERLKALYDDADRNFWQVAGLNDTLKAALARVRAALENIANHPHQSYPDNCGPYEIGVSDGHRCAANEARAALEGRG